MSLGESSHASLLIERFQPETIGAGDGPVFFRYFM